MIAISGTIFSVTRAMDLMPPIMTTPRAIAMIRPNSQPFPANMLDSPPVTLTTC